MIPTLAYSASVPPFDSKRAVRSVPATRGTPNLSASYSLIIVMLVYVLFGLAGFFAAAQLTF
jgi:hypothetical protein